MSHPSFSAPPARISNNTIIVFDGLLDDDDPTAKLVHNFLVLECGVAENPPQVRYVRVPTSGHLLNELEKLATACRDEGVRPIIQIECHGDPNLGLVWGADGRNGTLPWKHLSETLRRVNISADGNLGVLTACCFGIHAVAPLDVRRTTPFFFLVGPDDTIYSRPLLRETRTFYAHLIRHSNLSEAFTSLNACKYFFAVPFFYIAAARVYQKIGGRGRQGRIEQLVTLARFRNGATSPRPEQLREWRRVFKSNMTDGSLSDRFLVYAQDFLGSKAKGAEVLNNLFAWVKSLPSNRIIRQSTPRA
ncbi:hypothetical protein RAS12_24030 [Achromobacter seleniivolatilans]|uniref:Uncharacterized protein n=1 Tax=Achromobacter seleniivolatilans TaxID=3047478 RepID=A0ABY9LXZ9_9BURK|nr:hypothetical protein [Achromobacter sp. R39]WMD19659.1 hypothetical protein RAS12_24030 [Achromobacter sp. R39]